METTDIPTEENDRFEFKSSLTPLNELKKKVVRGVSALANSGGGHFIIGVDDKTGDPDGGIDKLIKKNPKQKQGEPVREWIEKAIHDLIQPKVQFTIALLDDAQGRGVIITDKAVVVIAVEESNYPPHMSAHNDENKYYIRAGARSVAAPHFLVEAMFARRSISAPVISMRLQESLGDDRASFTVTTLVLKSLTGPAVNVSIDHIDGKKPVPGVQGLMPLFPRHVPVIDSKEIRLQILTKHSMEGRLRVNYSDLLGNKSHQDFSIEEVYLQDSSLEANVNSNLGRIAVALKNLNTFLGVDNKLMLDRLEAVRQRNERNKKK